LYQETSSNWQGYAQDGNSQQLVHPALPYVDEKQVYKNLSSSSHAFEKVLEVASNDFNYSDLLPTAEDLLADASIQPLGTCEWFLI
jgi:hypothetical protein